MDFSITTLFVVPDSNSLPTTGSTETLTAGQFGIFKDKLRAAATAANIGTANYIQIAQGRPGTGLGTKISDRIKKENVTEWYKVVGHDVALDEVWALSSFSAKVGETVSLSIRTHSTFADMTSYNGLVQNVSIDTGCIECGGDPCAAVSNEDIIDALIAKIEETIAGQDSAGNALRLDSYLTFSKDGTGDDARLIIAGKPVQKLGFVCGDLRTRNVDKDRLWFRPFVISSPDTTVDFLAADNCNIAATATRLQASTFLTGTSEEIKQMEVDFYSYQARHKHLFSNPGWNGEFESYVQDGVTYDLYFIRFKEINPDSATFAPLYPIDERVIIAIPQGDGATIETILETYLGTVTDESGDPVTTSTTTTTTTT